MRLASLCGFAMVLFVVILLVSGKALAIDEAIHCGKKDVTCMSKYPTDKYSRCGDLEVERTFYLKYGCLLPAYHKLIEKCVERFPACCKGGVNHTCDWVILHGQPVHGN